MIMHLLEPLDIHMNDTSPWQFPNLTVLYAFEVGLWLTNIQQNCGFFSPSQMAFLKVVGKETLDEVLEMKDPKRSSWPLPGEQTLGIAYPAMTQCWPILDVLVISGMRWRHGWRGVGHSVAAQNNQNWLASRGVKFVILAWRLSSVLSSSLDLYSGLWSYFRLLK